MRRLIKIVLIVFLVGVIFISLLFLYPKFKNVTISVGSAKPSIDDFLTMRLFKKHSKLLTDINIINYDKTGEYDVEFSVFNKKKKVSLNIIDDIAPIVKVKDLQVSIKENINKDDFIVYINDNSNYEIIYDDSEVDYNKYGIYDIYIDVIDEYKNKTSSKATLKIDMFKEKVIHELDSEFDISELMLADDIKYSNLNLNELNINKIGDYNIFFEIDNKKYTSKICVRDNTAPVINVKEKNYAAIGEKIDIEDFIISITDSSKFEYKIDKDLNSLEIGSNIVKITAVDKYFNTSEKEIEIILKNNVNAPNIDAPKKIVIEKGQKYDYLKGVNSFDDIDGKCIVTFDDSNVDINKVGEYELIYKSYNKSLNLTTFNTKVVVLPTSEEIDKLYQSFYDKYLKDKSVIEMTDTIRKVIKYKKLRGENPLWTGLSTMSGGCVVHAHMLHKGLQLAGIESMVVNARGGYHSWVLVKENGKWRHYDPTPGKHPPGPKTDSEKKYEIGIGNLSWDSSYPKAE